MDCQQCGKPLTATHYNAKFCNDCKTARARAAAAEGMRKIRGTKVKKIIISSIPEIEAGARDMKTTYGKYTAIIDYKLSEAAGTALKSKAR